MRRTARAILGIADVFLAVIAMFTFYLEAALPDSYSVVAGESIHLPYPVEILGEQVLAVQSSSQPGYSFSAQMTFMKAIPVKDVSVRVVSRKMVRVSGAPFGIKMFTDGLMVVGMSDVATAESRINPARQAGVQIGDIVEKVDGVRLLSNEQLGGLVGQCGGKPVTLTVRREQERLEIEVPPVRSAGDGKYRLGIWVRDSSAGIGTMTYYDPNSGIFTGLGHPVCDVDTGDLMPLQSGEIVQAEITGCKAGRHGTPGELKGRFANRGTLGQLCGNTITGVYGYLGGDIHLGKELPIAVVNEVKVGKATIFTTVEGTVPKEYEVMIEKLEIGRNEKGQNMVIRVTDPELLEKTGGIVQGMSGSPVIQNGMLVGSVTHVFVNDPTRGFGIFAENIDATARTLSNNLENYQEAS